MKQFVYNKMNLAAYLTSLYKTLYKAEITPVKLHKALYYTYAFWGKKVFQMKQKGPETEVDGFYDNCPEELFDADFRAWHYGPVEVEMYRKLKESSLSDKVSEPMCLCDLRYEIEAEKCTTEIARRVFATSDFGLIDISKQEPAWKKGSKRKEKTMKFSEIIKTKII